MKKGRTGKMSLLAVAFLVALIGISFTLEKDQKNKKDNSNTNSNQNPEEVTDAIRFKNEYEELNGQKANGDKTFLEISIPEDNPMKYAELEEIMTLLKSGTGVIYFGRPNCPWCRNAVPVLIEAAKELEISDIYYYNVNAIKNEWAVKDGEVVKTSPEKEGYYDLLKILDKELDEYTVTDENGKAYEVGEKRIYVPMVVVVKDGTIMASHVSTVDLLDGQTSYDRLNDSQREELLNLYVEDLAESIDPGYCDEACE